MVDWMGEGWISAVAKRLSCTPFFLNLTFPINSLDGNLDKLLPPSSPAVERWNNNNGQAE